MSEIEKDIPWNGVDQLICRKCGKKIILNREHERYGMSLKKVVCSCGYIAWKREKLMIEERYEEFDHVRSYPKESWREMAIMEMANEINCKPGTMKIQ